MGAEFGTFQIVVSSLILLAAAAAIIGVRRVLKSLKRKLPKVDVNRVGAGVRWVIIALAFLLILSIFEFPLTAIVATVGALCGVLAIGFVANWSILCNFPCTLFLVVSKPFNVGDELELTGDKLRGEVVDITLAYTVLRDAEGFLVHIPNAVFLQKQFRRRPGQSTVSLSEQIRKALPAGSKPGDGGGGAAGSPGA